DYTVSADDAAFKRVLRAVSVIASLEYDPAEDADFWTLYNYSMNELESGAAAVDQKVGQLGITRNFLDQNDRQHKDLSLSLERFVSEVEDVDMADAISRLQDIQTQLQAAYQTTS